VSERAALNGWQTMDSAPRDGTQILVCTVVDFDGVAAWYYFTIFWTGLNWSHQLNWLLPPQYWQPIPPPPYTSTVNANVSVTNYPRNPT
jgi:hypothetical protein